MARFRILSVAICVFLLPFVAIEANNEGRSKVPQPPSTYFSSDTSDFELVVRGLKEYIPSQNPPDYFNTAMENYQLTHLFREGMEDIYDNPQICYICNLAVDLVILERREGMTRDTLAEEAEYLCIHLGIESRRVCLGVIELNIVSRTQGSNHN